MAAVFTGISCKLPDISSQYLSKFKNLDLRKALGDQESEDSDSEESTEDAPKNATKSFSTSTNKKFESTSNERPKSRYKSISYSSVMQSGINLKDVYIVTESDRNPSEAAAKLKQMAVKFSNKDEVLEGTVLKPGLEKEFSIPPYVESMRKIKAERKKEREKTKGPGWFHMPAPEITEEQKNDLEVLQMRKVLDPKRFYKKNDLKVLPKYFQVGKIVDSPIDFYHARVPKKDRKRTLVEELLADAEFKRYTKKKYEEAKAKQTQSRKAYKHMNKLKKRKK